MWWCMWHHASSLLGLGTTTVILTIFHCTLHKRQYYVSIYFYLYTLGCKWQDKWFWTDGPNGSSHFQNFICPCFLMGTQWRSWLRDCGARWKATGWVSNVVIGIFHWPYPSGRTMALGSNQPVTEMSTRTISWGWRRLVCRAEKFTTFMCWLSWNLGTLISWNPQGLCGDSCKC